MYNNYICLITIYVSLASIHTLMSRKFNRHHFIIDYTLIMISLILLTDVYTNSLFFFYLFKLVLLFSTRTFTLLFSWWSFHCGHSSVSSSRFHLISWRDWWTIHRSTASPSVPKGKSNLSLYTCETFYSKRTIYVAAASLCAAMPAAVFIWLKRPCVSLYK